MPAPERIVLTAGRLFLFLLLVATVMLVLEYGARRVFPSRSPFEQKFPVEIYRRPRPYTMFSGLPGGPGLNTIGYKGAVPALPKPVHEYRIIMLGGSTLVNGDPTIPDRIQKDFIEAGDSLLCVYNFGVVSSVSSMELMKILTEVVDYAPDMIIMYGGGNDIYLPLYWDPRPGYPFNFLVYENNPLLDKKDAAYPFLPLIAYGSTFVRHFFPSYFMSRFVPLESLRKRTGYLTPQWKSRIAKSYVSNLQKASTISRAFGAEFVAFLQPMLPFKHPLSQAEEHMFPEKDRSYYEELRSLIRTDIQRCSALSEPGSSFIDVSDVFSHSPEQVFIDVIHTTQDAIRIAADSMYAHIRTRVHARSQPGS